MKLPELLKDRLRKTADRLLKITPIQLMYRTIVALNHIDGAHRAAGVAYYAILSLFPLLLGLVVLLGLLWPSLNLQDQLLEFVGSNLPGASLLLNQNIQNILELRGTLGVLSIIGLFWSGSSMFGAISLAINRAWDIKPSRRFLIKKARDLGMALGFGLLFFLLSLGASAAISILRGLFKIPSSNLIVADLSSRAVAFLIILGVFLLLYKVVPQTRTNWRQVWPGALLASVLFEIARTLFIFYLENFANYQLIYGSIFSIIILLVWIYYSAFIMLLGAELAFQYGRLNNPKTA